MTPKEIAETYTRSKPWLSDERKNMEKLAKSYLLALGVVHAVKMAIVNTPHRNDVCKYAKNVGIDCHCWQKEVVAALDEMDQLK